MSKSRSVDGPSGPLQVIGRWWLPVLALLCLVGCGPERRSRAEALIEAEAQLEAVAAQHPAPLEEPEPVGLGSHAYEHLVVLPAAHLGSTVLGTPLFMASEAVQLVTPVWWFGAQDRMNEGVIALYESGPSFDRIYHLLPPSPPGASYARVPGPPDHAPVRGDLPR